MSGYEGAFIIGSVIEVTGGISTGTFQMVPREASVNSSTTGISDLTSTATQGTTALSTGDKGKAVIVDVYRPEKRYLGVSLNKTGAGKSMLGPVYAILYGNRAGVVSQSTSHVIDSGTVISPTT
jgi:hypothetical protein